MTYEQILKEFDEKFRFQTRGMMDIRAGSKIEQWKETSFVGLPEDIKSFLKQSFIKYLQSEVERLENMKQQPKYGYYHEDRIAANWEKVTIKVHNQAISDQIDHINQQLKELDTN